MYPREETSSEYDKPQVKKVKKREKWFGILRFEVSA